MTRTPHPAQQRRMWAFAGVCVALAAVSIDQISKYWLLRSTDLADGARLVITPFLDLVLVWNRGISYGLFRQDSELGRWILIGLTGAAIVLLVGWLISAGRAGVALPVGLIVGGAAGNLIDRIALGAVVDFLHFHVGQFSWYVFNVADVWIVAGVLILLYDSLRRR